MFAESFPPAPVSRPSSRNLASAKSHQNQGLMQPPELTSATPFFAMESLFSRKPDVLWALPAFYPRRKLLIGVLS